MKTLWYLLMTWRRPLPWRVKWRMARAQAGGYGLRLAGRMIARNDIRDGMVELGRVAERANDQTLAACVRAFLRRCK